METHLSPNWPTRHNEKQADHLALAPYAVPSMDRGVHTCLSVRHSPTAPHASDTRWKSRRQGGGTTIIGTPLSHWPYSSRQQCCVTPGKQEPWADHGATVAVRGRLRPALQRHLHAGLQDTTRGALCTWNRRAPATARMSWPHAMCGFIRRPMSDVEFHTPASGWRTKGSAQRVGSW